MKKIKFILIQIIIVSIPIIVIKIGTIGAQSSPQSISSIENSINSLNSQLSTYNSQLSTYNSQKATDSSNYNNINQIFINESNDLAAIQRLLANLNTTLSQDKVKLGKYIKEKNSALLLFYENSQINPIYLFFSNNNLSSFVSQWGVVQVEISKFKNEISVINAKINSIKNGITFQKTQEAKVSQEVATLNNERNQEYSTLVGVNNTINNIVGLSNNIKQSIINLQNQKAAEVRSQTTSGSGSQVIQNVNSTDVSNNTNNINNTIHTSNGGYVVNTSCNSGNCGTFNISVNGGPSFSNITGPIDINPASLNINSPISVSGSQAGAPTQYLGSIEIRNDTNVPFINILPLEYYVLGIGEEPSSWQYNALAAQAIAARTYALDHLGQFATDNYDVLNSTADQNYVGYSKYSQCGSGCNWVNAVNNTAGQILESNGYIIDALYSASNGGYELSDSQVYGGNYAYLQSASDGANHNYNATPSCFGTEDFNYAWINQPTLNSSQMAIIINDTNYFQNSSDSLSTKLNNLNQSWWQAPSQYDIANSSNISSLTTDVSAGLSNPVPSGNNTVTFNSTQLNAQDFAFVYNTVTPYGYYITTPNYNNYNFNSQGTLIQNYFALFTISGNSSSGFQLNSLANGSRLGMSQCGAEGRADAGESYQQILSHYYQNTNLVNYNTSSVNIRVGIVGSGTSNYTVTPSGGFSIYANGSDIYNGSGSMQITINQTN